MIRFLAILTLLLFTFGSEGSLQRRLDLIGSMQGAGGIGGLLARTDHSTVNPQPSTTFFHADGNGNISTLTDSSGAVVARYLYDPFGRVLGKWGPMADVNQYQFSSKETDNLTGLSYYGYRFYDPNLQRWLNHDPIREAGGINLYGFIGNEPVGSVDPYGLLFKDFFREIGQGLYDTGMEGGGGGDPNSLGKLWGENEKVDKDNNVLRDVFGEVCAVAGDQSTDAAAGAAVGGLAGKALEGIACKLGKPVKALLGKCGELLKRADDGCVCGPAAEETTALARSPWPGNSGFIEGTVERRFLLPGSDDCSAAAAAATPEQAGAGISGLFLAQSFR
jgi:RHS repeat-associated protein